MVQPKYESSHQMGDTSPVVILVLLGAFPMFGFCFLVMSIYVTYLGVIEGASILSILILLVLVLAASFFCLILGWVFIMQGLAIYRFEINGLQVKYPWHAQQTIPWDEFQQVCVIHAAFTTRGEPRANTVICCVMKGEKKNGYGRWKTDNPFKYRTVICIDYSPELHEGIKNRCPYEVVDLRNTYAYRLWSDYHRF